MPFELAITVRPLLVEPSQQAVFLLTAHLIIFWLSQDSNVTPPVCLAAFAAAGIAGSKPMETGFQAWKIAKGLYIVPLMFAYTPLISGDWSQILQVGLFGLFGIYAINSIIQLHAEGPLNWPTGIMMVLGAIGAFWPLFWIANIAGACLVCLAVFMTLKQPSRLERNKSDDLIKLEMLPNKKP